MKPRLRYSSLYGLWYIARFPTHLSRYVYQLCELVRNINRLNTGESNGP